MIRCMTLTDLALLTLRNYTLTRKTCISKKNLSITTMSCTNTMPLSFKMTRTTTQMIYITGQAALHTTTPEFEGVLLPLCQPQGTLTLPMTINALAHVLHATL